MFESTKDILYIVIAFCVLWITIFLCWVIYYVAMILRQTYGLMNDVKDTMKGIDDTIKGVREKLEHSSTYLALIADGAKHLISYLGERKEKRKSKKKTTKIEL